VAAPERISPFARKVTTAASVPLVGWISRQLPAGGVSCTLPPGKIASGGTVGATSAATVSSSPTAQASGDCSTVTVSPTSIRDGESWTTEVGSAPPPAWTESQSPVAWRRTAARLASPGSAACQASVQDSFGVKPGVTRIRAARSPSTAESGSPASPQRPMAAPSGAGWASAVVTRVFDAPTRGEVSLARVQRERSTR
jgi:hypothetical protein